MKYHELNYVAPKVSAQAAANKAIATLEDVAKVDAEALFYTIQPSNIIALAGLRAQSPYNDFLPDFSEAHVKRLKEVLKKHGCFIQDNTTPYDDTDGRYFSLVNQHAWEDLPKRYKIFGKQWYAPLDYESMLHLNYWSDYCHLLLVGKMESGELPAIWLREWWAPHNLRFGMLLGYPGSAISSNCWDDAERAQGKKVPENLEADIVNPLYCGTLVSFAYTPSLKKDPDILYIQKLWTEVLDIVYEAFPKQRLVKMPEFVKEYDEYRKYDRWDNDDLADVR